MKVCQVCGTHNAADAEFCTNCGSYLGWDARSEPPVRRPGPPGRPTAAPDGVRVELTGAPPPGELTPGQEYRVEARVRNVGTLVDEFVPTVTAPVPWIRVEPPRLSIYPGGQEQVALVLAPPAGAATAAGTVPYRLDVRSGTRPQLAASLTGSVTVRPVDALSAEIAPSTAFGRRRAGARVLVRNDGNRPVPVTLGQPIQGVGIRAQPVPEAVEVPAGAAAEVAVRLRADRRRWFGQPVTHPYRLRVTPTTGGRPLDLDAAMLQRPLLPWVPRAAALILPLLALGATLLVGLTALVIANTGQGGDGGNPDEGPTAVVTSAEQTTDAPPGGGQEVVAMPDLVGRSFADARDELDRLGLRVADVLQTPSGEADEGVVIATDPRAGDQVRQGSAVRVLVSTGGDGGETTPAEDGGG